MRHLLFAMSILSMAVTSFGIFNLEYQWKYIDFVWENEDQKAEALRTGRYNATAITLFDLDNGPNDKMILSLVRDKGVPVSLATISKQVGEGGPLLRPYPDWSWYKDDCDGISAGVYRIEIECNHLYVVDGGRLGDEHICPPKLLIFDLATDKLVKRVLIPTDVTSDKTNFTLLSSVYVYMQNCTNIKDNGIVLMADVEGNALVVYNPQIPKFCRIETEYMKATEPNVFIENQYFPLNDGIYNLGLFNNDLYYTAFGGSKMYKIDISKILTCTMSDSEASQQSQLTSVLPGQTGAITSEDCVLFFSNIADYNILCADATKGDFRNNVEVVARDSRRLQFVTGLKNRFDKLMILSSRYQKHITRTLNTNEVNFHIFRTSILNLKNNTKCFIGCNK